MKAMLYDGDYRSLAMIAELPAKRRRLVRNLDKSDDSEETDDSGDEESEHLLPAGKKRSRLLSDQNILN